uniref:UBC core domain-containing protein n=1 Tax=Plectus sambesii TaxID=2011161 RepID=A0A914WYY9_9BILA
MAQPSPSSSGAMRALTMELKGLKTSPVEGFTVTVDDENIFSWIVAIYGPPATLYQGAYFKAALKFPSNYPYSPPTVRFLSKVWHPNVYEVCLYIFFFNNDL